MKAEAGKTILPEQNIKKSNYTGRLLLVMIGGLCMLVVALALSVARGATQIPLSLVVEALFHFDPQTAPQVVVRDLRLPRALASMLVGAAFAAAGALMQGTARNPMADSGLLGLNAGAGLSLSICFAFFPSTPYLFLLLYSFLGAAAGAALVYGVSSLGGEGASPLRLVLAGAAVSFLFSALSQGIAIYFEVAQDMMFWTAGGVAGTTWQQLHWMVPWVGMGLAAAVLISPSVSLLSLGEEVALGLGLRTGLIKLGVAVIVWILAGVSVSVVGNVGFVGLMIPHFARYLVGVDYRRILPTSMVLGSLLMVLADLGARTLNPPFEIPVGAIIALVGVPFFLYLAQKQRRGKE